jgi:hypothetical protein
MADLYESVSVTNYNLNPPADDGTVSDANKITWAKHKQKLGDPLNTAIAAIDANITAAMAKMLAGADVVSSAVDYEASGDDQGRLIIITGSTKTITTPDATDVASPFVFSVLNNASTNMTLEGFGAQTINGATNLSIIPNGGGFLVTNGTNWFYFGSGLSTHVEFVAGTVGIFGQTSAPTGWTKDTSFDDAVIALTSGSVGDVAGTALSDVLDSVTIAQVNLPAYNLDVTDLLTSSALVSLNSNATGSSGASKVVSGNGSQLTISGDLPLGGSGTALDFAAKRAKVIRATKA